MRLQLPARLGSEAICATVLEAVMIVGLLMLAQFVSGTVVAAVLGRAWPTLSHGLAGALTLGGLGGVIVASLKDHISGAHHHMNGVDMPGMSMAPSADAATLTANVLWAGGGAVVFVGLAAVIGWLVPNRSPTAH